MKRIKNNLKNIVFEYTLFMKGIVMKSMSRSVAAGVFIMLLFAFIQNLSACPLVKDIKAEPEVICAKNGETTISFTADWSDPNRLPWDKNHTIKWSVRKDGGEWSEEKEVALKGKADIGSDGKTASGSFKVGFVNAEAGNYIIRVRAAGEKDGKLFWNKDYGTVQLTLVQVEIIKPNQDFLCQGDIKDLDALHLPSGRITKWGVKPDSKVGITEKGTLFFKPYGDTSLKDSEVTVTAYDSEVPKCKDEQIIYIKGFKRPGNIELKGTKIEEPPWVGTHAYSTLGSSDSGKDKDNKDLGIKYQCDKDECTGRIIKRQFKYKVECILLTSVDVPFGEPKDVYAVAAIYNAKNGVQQFCFSRGCANDAITIGISVGPLSVGISCPDQDNNNFQDWLKYTEINNNSIDPHAPKSKVLLDISMTGHAACKTEGGWGSEASAGAYILPHTLTEREGQFKTKEAIIFNPKVPDKP